MARIKETPTKSKKTNDTKKDAKDSSSPKVVIKKVEDKQGYIYY